MDGLHFEFFITYTVMGSKFLTTKDQPVALYIDVTTKYHIKAEYLYICNSQNKKRNETERKLT